ncbi:Hsp20 family protein [Microbulbifer aggregans]|uniref:Hsp20 family protein n=1 Tax=Microbulbifer aggregans TaxID=1769779 RepID=UPI001CFDF4B4|nr:Hsp20 family protein [Microbulbifer aggregans]
MRSLDLSPLYRSAIGYDRLANLLDSMASTEQNQPAYPPYNIELTGEDAYRISMAVAGFDEAELDIQLEQNRLTVSGQKPGNNESSRNFLHRGIAARNFERRFQLADHVRVTDAQLVNGLLHIDLVREIPEAMKPRKIEISNGKLLHAEKGNSAQSELQGSESERAA